MSKSCFLLFLLLWPFWMMAQEDSDKSRRMSQRRERKVLAQQQINQLHNGVLLIRLKTKANSIAALRSQGKNEQADKIAREQFAYNKSVVKAFERNFDFCPVYFCFSDVSQKVKKEEFDQLTFLNGALQTDSNIRWPNTPFLTAEFGQISRDTTRYFDGYYYESGENGLERKARYYGASSSRSFNGLFVKSEQFVQLRRPFPYYVRTLDSLPIEKSPAEVVAKLNKRLHKYFLKVNR